MSLTWEQIPELSTSRVATAVATEAVPLRITAPNSLLIWFSNGSEPEPLILHDLAASNAVLTVRPVQPSSDPATAAAFVDVALNLVAKAHAVNPGLPVVGVANGLHSAVRTYLDDQAKISPTTPQRLDALAVANTTKNQWQKLLNEARATAHERAFLNESRSLEKVLATAEAAIAGQHPFSDTLAEVVKAVRTHNGGGRREPAMVPLAITETGAVFAGNYPHRLWGVSNKATFVENNEELRKQLARGGARHVAILGEADPEMARAIGDLNVAGTTIDWVIPTPTEDHLALVTRAHSSRPGHKLSSLGEAGRTALTFTEEVNTDSTLSRTQKGDLSRLGIQLTPRLKTPTGGTLIPKTFGPDATHPA